MSPVQTMAFRRILLSFSSCVQFKIMWLIVCSSFSPRLCICIRVCMYVCMEGGRETCIYAVHDRQRVSNRSSLIRWIIMK